MFQFAWVPLVGVHVLPVSWGLLLVSASRRHSWNKQISWQRATDRIVLEDKTCQILPAFVAAFANALHVELWLVQSSTFGPAPTSKKLSSFRLHHMQDMKETPNAIMRGIIKLPCLGHMLTSSGACSLFFRIPPPTIIGAWFDWSNALMNFCW